AIDRFWSSLEKDGAYLSMIIKPIDSLRARKLELEILKSFHLPADKAYLVNEEWKRLTRGEKGEKNTAYLLDFFLDDKKNWVLIHDLRLDYKGKVAQIDHLIITRALDIYVLETKAYGDKLHILDDGSFIASYGKKEFSVPSPLEQNKRHLHILEKAIQPLLPKRLGVTLQPLVESYVLVDESTILKRSKTFDSSHVVKAEQFLSKLDEKYDALNVGEVLTKASKLISQKSVKDFAKAIADLHCKSTTNYKERFGITDDDQKEAEPTCKGCGGQVTSKNISFCTTFNERFKGHTYCFNCQKSIVG
ncbi:MAG: nuclease-related domain-containing protein, partial [Ghiorsea sp.]|nr:nuclease-related domain-containing protein [Ghiorsea sp.]